MSLFRYIERLPISTDRLWERRAFRRPLRTCQFDGPREKVVHHSHAAVSESVVDGVGETFGAKNCLDLVMSEKVTGASESHCRETFRTDPVGFSFVNEGRGSMLKRISDRRSFAVIQRLSGRTGYEHLEMPLPRLSEPYDSNTTGGDQGQ